MTDQLRSAAPIPMFLNCPSCGARHIDEGDFATKVHHTHSCQSCGLTWRPAIEPTVGVAFLPGFKNAPDSRDAEIARLREALQFTATALGTNVTLNEHGRETVRKYLLAALTPAPSAPAAAPAASIGQPIGQPIGQTPNVADRKPAASPAAKCGHAECFEDAVGHRGGHEWPQPSLCMMCRDSKATSCDRCTPRPATGTRAAVATTGAVRCGTDCGRSALHTDIGPLSGYREACCGDGSCRRCGFDKARRTSGDPAVSCWQDVLPPDPAAESPSHGGTMLPAGVSTFCAECGPDVNIDEDNCCVACGATAWGRWLEEAGARPHQFDIQLRRVRAELHRLVPPNGTMSDDDDVRRLTLALDAEWNAAIEAAAKRCEGRANGHEEQARNGQGWSVARGEARKCANAIRALRRGAR